MMISDAEIKLHEDGKRKYDLLQKFEKENIHNYLVDEPEPMQPIFDNDPFDFEHYVEKDEWWIQSETELYYLTAEQFVDIFNEFDKKIKSGFIKEKFIDFLKLLSKYYGVKLMAAVYDSITFKANLKIYSFEHFINLMLAELPEPQLNK